ncbi:hypothetical protein MAPG_08489 [Magnaporthiopsis poae ATCC 64411]|uniref:3beta-hydroxysteroid 3-dehydrogenase n=1 Tax=Magnaporthiopsis poae (strain ATCC 64411 / 73-15) TaxID=644358 RepID=A0A0C4E7H6_MAGP6|nr:hypothetical protein MAPG_08489 [Magnaporthiopsis poae ATCC 64411]
MAKGTVIVTGANGGLGSTIAKKLLSEPAYTDYHVLFTVRKVETATTLQGVLDAHKAKKGPGTIEVVACDLSSLASTRDVANDINARVADGRLPPIRAIIENAAYQEHSEQNFSNDGFDMTFHATYLGHWLLTLKLLQSIDKEIGRIVVVGSYAHDPLDRRTASMGIYAEDKWKTLFPDADSLAKGQFGGGVGLRRHELQPRLEADPALSRISLSAVDPGAMPTSILRRGSFYYRFFVARVLIPLLTPVMALFAENPLMRSTEKSATDLLNAAFSEDAPYGQHPKDLYFDGNALRETSAESRDKAKLKDLWTSSVRYTSLSKEETALTQWK